MTDADHQGARPLIEKLDIAVGLSGTEAITERVKGELSDLIVGNGLELPDRYCRPRTGCYARRLLHRDRGRRYSVVVMTWGPGQGTPLHDHAGIWCVEAVVQGEMEVTQFDLVEESGPLCRFHRQSLVSAGVGSSGSLIPPFEYHVLKNAVADRPSVTLHVYGGEMDRCSTFVPRDDGWYERIERPLAYHD